MDRKVKNAATMSIVMLFSQSAFAAVSAEEAGKLGTTLTAVGAEMAGNKDGSIPPYKGGLGAMPSLPKPDQGKGRYPDPFADEQPLFSINAQNMAGYADKLTPGMQALLKRLPGFRMDVYPSHRTAFFPDRVKKNTLRNATSARLVNAEGDGVTGAAGGVPFPIPQSGLEVLWNNILRFHANYEVDKELNGYLVDSAGGITNLGAIESHLVYPYYDPSIRIGNGKFYSLSYAIQLTPPPLAGTQYLFYRSMDYTKADSTTWFYSPGQRRVRIAPEFKYDMPVASYGGAIDFDEITYYQGQPDRFDFKLIGKKEMFIGYNNYKLSGVIPVEKILETKFQNPDVLRYEKHRVWVVDATLKPNKRHAFSRWTFYMDEDTWSIVAMESYDHANALYRVTVGYPYILYPNPETASISTTNTIYDLSKGSYCAIWLHTSDRGGLRGLTAAPDSSRFTAESITGRGR
jgi:Protein of unknown function (DUF1329)